MEDAMPTLFLAFSLTGHGTMGMFMFLLGYPWRGGVLRGELPGAPFETPANHQTLRVVLELKP